MNANPERLFLVTWRLFATGQYTLAKLEHRLRYDASQDAIEQEDKKQKRSDWTAIEYRQFGWLVRTTRSAVEIYLELVPLLSDGSELLVAEVTANTFGSFVDKRNHEIAAIFGSARRD